VEVTAEQEDTWSMASKRLGGDPSPHSWMWLRARRRRLLRRKGPVAQFMYQEKNGQRLTLYIKTDAGSERETAFRFAQEGSVGVFYWIDHRLSYALSGECGKEELLKVANAVYQKLNP
jgi:anti-sigma factor RsiW